MLTLNQALQALKLAPKDTEIVLKSVEDLGNATDRKDIKEAIKKILQSNASLLAKSIAPLFIAAFCSWGQYGPGDEELEGAGKGAAGYLMEVFVELGYVTPGTTTYNSLFGLFIAGGVIINTLWYGTGPVYSLEKEGLLNLAFPVIAGLIHYVGLVANQGDFAPTISEIGAYSMPAFLAIKFLSSYNFQLSAHVAKMDKLNQFLIDNDLVANPDHPVLTITQTQVDDKMTKKAKAWGAFQEVSRTAAVLGMSYAAALSFNNIAAGLPFFIRYVPFWAQSFLFVKATHVILQSNTMETIRSQAYGLVESAVMSASKRLGWREPTDEEKIIHEFLSKAKEVGIIPAEEDLENLVPEMNDEALVLAQTLTLFGLKDAQQFLKDLPRTEKIKFITFIYEQKDDKDALLKDLNDYSKVLEYIYAFKEQFPNSTQSRSNLFARVATLSSLAITVIPSFIAYAAATLGSIDEDGDVSFSLSFFTILGVLSFAALEANFIAHCDRGIFKEHTTLALNTNKGLNAVWWTMFTLLAFSAAFSGAGTVKAADMFLIPALQQLGWLQPGHLSAEQAIIITALLSGFFVNCIDTGPLVNTLVDQTTAAWYSWTGRELPDDTSLSYKKEACYQRMCDTIETGIAVFSNATVMKLMEEKVASRQPAEQDPSSSPEAELIPNPAIEVVKTKAEAIAKQIGGAEATVKNTIQFMYNASSSRPREIGVQSGIATFDNIKKGKMKFSSMA